MDLGASTPATVDLHTHFFPAGLGDRMTATGDDRWPSLAVGSDGRGRIMRGATVFRPVAPTCWDPAARLEAMDAAGIDVHVLSPVPVTLTTWAEPRLAADFARQHNELLAEAAATAPTRLRWMGSVPLQDGDLAAAELERASSRLGMVGVEIGTEVAGRELDDPALRPFFEAADELGVAIFVHPTDGPGAIRRGGVPYEFGLGMLTDTALAATALVFGGVLEALPRLRVALAHGCGTFPWSYPRLRRGATLGPGRAGATGARTDGATGARTDGDTDALVRRLWADSLVFDPAHLPVLFERFGADHVVLGSDFPFYPPSWGGPLDVLDEAVRTGRCTPGQSTAVRSTNGLRFLDPADDRPSHPAHQEAFP
jgi:aminocarboxymuconate-semialdehyde decarboxylase